MSSILTNNSAMVALQTLQGINRDLSTTQSQISTGKKVANAADNAAIWAISKTMESDVSGFQAIKESLSLGSSTVAVARNAAETTQGLLDEIKTKVIAAQEGNVDRDKVQADIDQLKDQITGVLESAQFNGLNLVNGSNTDAMQTLSSLNRTDAGVVDDTIDVETQNLTFNGFAGTPTEGLLAAGSATTAINGGDNVAITPTLTADNPSYFSMTVNGQTFTVEMTLDEFNNDAASQDQAGANAYVAEQLTAQLDAAFGENVLEVTDNSGIEVNIGGSATTNVPYRIELGNGNVGALAPLDGLTVNGTDTERTDALEDIETMIDAATDAAAAFGSAQRRFEIQEDFVSTMVDSLKSGIGALVDTNMEEASARLQALQVQQQLGVQSLSIANQAPQTILSLFR